MRKNTIQRQLILAAVKGMEGHPSAEDVCTEVKRLHPTISRSTVYRILRQLADEGIIMPVVLPQSPERFDNRLSQHYHFTCKKCGKIFDVDIDYIAEANEKVRQLYGFEVDDHDVFFKGICNECKAHE